MPLIISLLLFLNLAIVVVYLAYMMFRKPAPAVERLQNLNRSVNVLEAPAAEAGSPLERLHSILRPLGEVLPKSPRDVSRTRKQLYRAGYRGRAAVTIFYGIRLLTALALPLIFYAGFIVAGDIPARQQLGLAVISGLIGYLLPSLILQARIKTRQGAVTRGLPDALDLMVVCVEAGLGLDQAIMRVGEELKQVTPEISDEFNLVNLEMRAGKPRVDALRNMATRVGVDDLSSLVAMLVQTDRFGTSIAQSLRVHSDSMRVKRRQRAEELASKVPVKLVFPIFFFIFPAIFIVTLAPAVLEFIRKVLPTMN